MLKSRGTVLALGVLLGLIVGLNLVGLWPQIPVHATATHGQENFAMCTGPVDADIEAIYSLDYLTGELRAAIVSNQNGKFLSLFEANVAKDLAIVGAVKNPKFLMVTGIADVRRGAQAAQPSKSLLYVSEVTSGQIAAYAIPWSPQAHAAGKQQSGQLALLDTWKFRAAAPAPAAKGKKGKS
jgi:hypothetical protein